MTSKKDSASKADVPTEMRDALQQLLFGQAGDLERVVEEQNLNMEYMGRINDVALRGAHTLVTRQGAALRETFDDLTLVLNEVAGRSVEPGVSDAHMRCLELSVARGLEHLRIAFDWANEMNQSTWDLMQQRLERNLGAAKSDRGKAAKQN